MRITVDCKPEEMGVLFDKFVDVCDKYSLSVWDRLQQDFLTSISSSAKREACEK